MHDNKVKCSKRSMKSYKKLSLEMFINVQNACYQVINLFINKFPSVKIRLWIYKHEDNEQREH